MSYRGDGLPWVASSCSFIFIFSSHAGTLQPLVPTVMAVANQPVALSCELYGYAEDSEDIMWQFNDVQLQSDSVYTISVERGNRSLQRGGDTPEASILSLLTVQRPNSSHDGTYICAASGMIRTLNLDVEGKTCTVHHEVIYHKVNINFFGVWTSCM